MTGEDILNFITSGVLRGIEPGMPISEVHNILGPPDEKVGDSQVGYLIYGILSFGYFGSTIDELAVRFYRNKTTSFITDENEFGETQTISGESKIHEILYLLNSRGLLWDCYNKVDLDYFIIRSQKGVGIVFDLYDGTLNRISYAKL